MMNKLLKYFTEPFLWMVGDTHYNKEETAIGSHDDRKCIREACNRHCRKPDGWDEYYERLRSITEFYDESGKKHDIWLYDDYQISVDGVRYYVSRITKNSNKVRMDCYDEIMGCEVLALTYSFLENDARQV